MKFSSFCCFSAFAAAAFVSCGGDESSLSSNEDLANIELGVDYFTPGVGRTFPIEGEQIIATGRKGSGELDGYWFPHALSFVTADASYFPSTLVFPGICYEFAAGQSDYTLEFDSKMVETLALIPAIIKKWGDSRSESKFTISGKNLQDLVKIYQEVNALGGVSENNKKQIENIYKRVIEAGLFGTGVFARLSEKQNEAVQEIIGTFEHMAKVETPLNAHSKKFRNLPESPIGRMVRTRVKYVTSDRGMFPIRELTCTPEEQQVMLEALYAGSDNIYTSDEHSTALLRISALETTINYASVVRFEVYNKSNAEDSFWSDANKEFSIQFERWMLAAGGDKSGFFDIQMYGGDNYFMKQRGWFPSDYLKEADEYAHQYINFSSGVLINPTVQVWALPYRLNDIPLPPHQTY